MSSSFREDLVAAIPMLRGFARSLSGNRDRADDLVQETLAKAIANRDKYRPGTNLHAWLVTILRNQYYSEGRRRWREVSDAEGTHAARLTEGPVHDSSDGDAGVPRGAAGAAPRPARGAGAGRRERALLRGGGRGARHPRRHGEEPGLAGAGAARGAAGRRRGASRGTKRGVEVDGAAPAGDVGMRGAVQGFSFADRLSATAARIERLEGGAVDGVAFAEVDGAAGVAFEAGVEEASPGRSSAAPLAKVSFTTCLVGLAGADDAGVGPDRDPAPLPLLDHLGVGLLHRARGRGRASRRASRRVRGCARRSAGGSFPSPVRAAPARCSCPHIRSPGNRLACPTQAANAPRRARSSSWMSR